MEDYCKHCGHRIVRINFALGPRWVHQPYGASFNNGTFVYCQQTVAEPMEEIKQPPPGAMFAV